MFSWLLRWLKHWKCDCLAVLWALVFITVITAHHREEMVLIWKNSPLQKGEWVCMTEKIREARRVWWSRVTTREASRDPTELGWQQSLSSAPRGEWGQSQGAGARPWGKTRLQSLLQLCQNKCSNCGCSRAFQGLFWDWTYVFLCVEVPFHPHKFIKRLLRAGLLHLWGKKG